MDDIKMLALQQSAESDLLVPGGGSSYHSDTLATGLSLM